MKVSIEYNYVCRILALYYNSLKFISGGVFVRLQKFAGRRDVFV